MKPDAAENRPRRPVVPALRDPLWMRLGLIVIAVLFLLIFLVMPLGVLFSQALRGGIDAYVEAILDEDALDALRLTLLIAAIAVPANLLFGIAASWCLAKF